MKKCEGKVGPFFYLNGKVVSDSVDYCKGENYGDSKTWGSHDHFWNALGKANKQYRETEYYSYPRGRITYNTVEDTFHIYLNPKLNTAPILERIIEEFNLTGLKYVVDDTDMHYKIYSDIEFDML